MSPALFAALVSAALLMTVAALALLGYVAAQSRVQSRLSDRLRGAEGLTEEEGPIAAGPLSGLLALLVRSGRWLERRLDPDNESSRLLAQAGWRSAAQQGIWHAFQAVCPLAAVVFSVALWTFAVPPLKPLVVLLYGVMALILSILAPRWVLRSAAESRRTHIRQEVPLFIHLLVLLFEAGLSTRQALASLVREGRGVLPTLGEEFARVLRSLDAGGDTGEALRGMGNALEVSDLNGVLAVLRQVDRYGGEVREPLLDTLAIIEERNSLDLRERINRMSGRMTVVMVMFFFPALLIFVAGPAFVSILKALGEAAAG